MDPSRNPALQNAKLQTFLQDLQSRRDQSTTLNPAESTEGMPPPPAYHSVVNGSVPLPSLHNPYDADDDEKEDDDTPEVNINATTQIRGHGNIISIAQMDSVRIANLIAILLHGGVPPTVPLQHAAAQGQAPAHGMQAAAHRHRAERRDARHWPKININVNCGATVIGDRNIVGPGLGDIARHMQMAQRNQAAQQQNQMNANRTAGAQNPGLGFPVHGQTTMATPPMSRSSSFGSEGAAGVKRKVEEGAEESAAKKSC